MKNFLRKLLGMKPKNEIIRDIDRYIQSLPRDPKTGKWIQDAEEVIIAQLPKGGKVVSVKVTKVAEDFSKSEAAAPKPTAKKPVPKKTTPKNKDTK